MVVEAPLPSFTLMMHSHNSELVGGWVGEEVMCFAEGPDLSQFKDGMANLGSKVFS